MIHERRTDFYFAEKIISFLEENFSKDQIIFNNARAFTITLPSSPSAADTVIIANAGAGTVTVGRNSSNINSAAEDGSLPQGNSAQLVYVDGTIGWFEI